MPVTAEIRPIAPKFDTVQFLQVSNVMRDHINLARKDIQPSNPLAPTLNDKYETIGHLLHAVETIIQLDRVKTQNIGAVVLTALAPLVDKYGLEYIQGNPTQDATYKPRLQKYAQDYKAKTPQIDPNDLSFATPSWNGSTPKPSAELYADTEPVTPQGTLSTHTDMVSYTRIVNSYSFMQDTVQYIPSRSTSSFSSASSGSSRNERSFDLGFSALLLFRLGKSILWEGFNGNALDLEQVAAYINLIAGNFDIYVDVKP